MFPCAGSELFRCGCRVLQGDGVHVWLLAHHVTMLPAVPA